MAFMVPKNWVSKFLKKVEFCCISGQVVSLAAYSEADMVPIVDGKRGLTGLS